MNARQQIDAYLADDRGAAPCCAFGSDPDDWTPYARALALVYVGYGEEPGIAVESATSAIVNSGDREAYALMEMMPGELHPDDTPEPPDHWPDDWREQVAGW